MKEIKCPHCGKMFTVDESGYAAIVSQIKDEEFSRELEKREKELKKVISAELEKKSNDDQNDLKEKISDLEKEIIENKNIAKLDMIKAINDKDKEIESLKSKIKNADAEKQIAISKAESEKEKEISDLKIKLSKTISDKEIEITKIKSEKDTQISTLQTEIASSEKKHTERQIEMKDDFDRKLKEKDDQIAYFKDLKSKMSTKMIGETLEQHCSNEFNKYRTTMFPNAEFHKDNEISKESGSKGDFVFRDFLDDIEYLSIMFEMKNESDTTSTKKKNEDFFKELDKDRKEKNCEYAVLVSLLEPENEFYNSGIVDVSYAYQKMYVIRPQCFIAMITLLANAAKNSLSYKKELKIIKDQNLDITHFEDDLHEFQEKFGRNYELAKDKFEKAINEIDKTIASLQKVKDGLLGSQNNLRLANEKAQDLTIKKLTSHNPTMKQAFENLKKDK